MSLSLLIIMLYALIAGIMFVTYLLYPLLHKFVYKPNKRRGVSENYGAVYVIISAYNEEKVIKDKIKNTLKYFDPKGEIVVVSDASDDETNTICERLAKEHKQVRFLVNKERGGKNACINLAVRELQPNNDDILIFTDCNTFFDENSIQEIIKPLLSGSYLVAGSMVYNTIESDSAISEGMYWKYEEWIRRNESANGQLIVCNGGLFGMWAAYFETLPPFVPNDFEGPLRLCGKGKHVMLNPKAKGIETAINSSEEEYSRKQRMANRQMNCISYLWKELNAKTKIQVLFHKFFRWFGFHLFLFATILILFSWVFIKSVLINVIAVLHLLAIGLIFLAFLNQFLEIDKNILPKVLHAVKVHTNGAKGALMAIFGVKTAVWKKAETNR